MQNAGKIMECGNRGEISGIWDVGGIVGAADYEGDCVERCINQGSVALSRDGSSSYNYPSSGGIVGNSYGIIRECINLGNVFALGNETRAGGIAGYSRGTVTASINKGDISADGTNGAYCGGIVGYNYYSEGVAYVTKCGNYGTVRRARYAGGIVGGATSYGDISDCFNRGTVQDSYYAGSIAGLSNGSISRCYRAGSVSGVWTAGSGGITTRTSAKSTAFYAFSEKTELTKSDLPGFDFDTVWYLSEGKALLQDTKGFEDIRSTHVFWLSDEERLAAKRVIKAEYSDAGRLVNVKVVEGKVVDLTDDLTRKLFYLDEAFTPQFRANELR